MGVNIKLSKRNVLVMRELIGRGYFRDRHELTNHILFTYFDSKDFYSIFGNGKERKKLEYNSGWFKHKPKEIVKPVEPNEEDFDLDS